MDDWRAPNARAALKISVDVFCRRAAYEVADLQRALAQVCPDALIVDVNCWGAQSVADAAGIPRSQRTISQSRSKHSRPARAGPQPTD